ncbi:MAG TPA: DHHA1 domain-containing protein [Pyrinomonadaceae bacterium]|nr:DHHA1 domain-containing protein [Pyrinomonadaceae bacterium]
MTGTERLYYADSHLTEFDARVVSRRAAGEGRAAVTLDRTAFYPTGGGQPSDTGLIGAARVVECVDEEEAGVVHIVEGEAPEAGASVKGRVDWPRRLDHIQQHTGQHILSQAFVELFRAETRGFRMSAEVSEIDVELDAPSDERIERAVERANAIIWDDRAVRIHNVTASEAAAMPLRKDSAREGELRVIEIEGFDMSPCGGTHAQRTGEVGIIAARSWERAKGMTRIEFVAGARALADYRRANRTARGVAALFSVGRDESAAAVVRLLDENKALTRRVRALEEIAARVEAAELLAGARRRARDGARIVSKVLEAREAESLKRLASALAAHARTVALVAARDGESVRLVFARSADADDDMNALMREACSSIDGRGGGRPEMAQGGGRWRAGFDEMIEALARKISV